MSSYTLANRWHWRGDSNIHDRKNILRGNYPWRKIVTAYWAQLGLEWAEWHLVIVHTLSDTLTEQYVIVIVIIKSNNKWQPKMIVTKGLDIMWWFPLFRHAILFVSIVLWWPRDASFFITKYFLWQFPRFTWWSGFVIQATISCSEGPWSTNMLSV